MLQSVSELSSYRCQQVCWYFACAPPRCEPVRARRPTSSTLWWEGASITSHSSTPTSGNRHWNLFHLWQQICQSWSHFSFDSPIGVFYCYFVYGSLHLCDCLHVHHKAQICLRAQVGLRGDLASVRGGGVAAGLVRRGRRALPPHVPSHAANGRLRPGNPQNSSFTHSGSGNSFVRHVCLTWILIFQIFSLLLAK